MRDVEPGQVWLRRGGSDTRQFAIRGVSQAVHAAEASATGDFRIEVELRCLSRAEAEEQRRGQGHIALGIFFKLNWPSYGEGNVP